MKIWTVANLEYWVYGVFTDKHEAFAKAAALCDETCDIVNVFEGQADVVDGTYKDIIAAFFYYDEKVWFESF